MQAACARLDQELRKSKRREEKLTALQFRLKEDVQQMGINARFGSMHGNLHDGCTALQPVQKGSLHGQ